VRELIFFDVGGTLLHFRPSFAARFGAACHSLGIGEPVAGWNEAVASARRGMGGPPDAVDLDANRAWWHRFYASVLSGCERASGDPASALWAMHRAGDWLTPEPKARETLELLRSRGHRLAIISNWDDTLEAILRRRALLDLFDLVVASTDVGAAKPDAAIFHLALERAGVAAEAAIHVGDDLEADVAGARTAGIRPIHFGAKPAGDVESVATLGDLVRLLDH
jgi:putative hydrolase of the HAD superfamily